MPHKHVLHFDHASSDINADDQAALVQLVNTLPEVYWLTITGYTDNSGHSVINQTLARQRAMSVTNHLIELGIDKSNLTINASPLCCYVAANTTESGRAKNRRTEIVISTLANEGIKP